MERHSCSGTMSGGTRQCYFTATIKIGNRWFCRKCVGVRARVRQRASSLTKPTFKPLPEKDLITLYQSVMRSKASGQLDANSSKELVFTIMPMLLRELFHLRGLKEPSS